MSLRKTCLPPRLEIARHAAFVGIQEDEIVRSPRPTSPIALTASFALRGFYL